MRSVIGIILAGGSSKRFGKNKALVEYEGKRLIDITYSKLSRAALISHVYISAKNVIPGYPPHKIIIDFEDISAPITGILSSLSYLKNDVFVVGCDMPCIEPVIVDFIVSKALSAKVLFASLSVKEDTFEPLFAYYSYDIFEILLNNFSRKNYSLQKILKPIRNKMLIKIDDLPLDLADAAKKSIINLNKQEDLKILRECLSSD